MHRRPSLFKACVFVLAASSAVMGMAQAADSKLDSVLARGKLIVGTGSTNAPWHFQGADGKLQGFDIDIARIVAKGLFNDPSKVEFVVQSSDARIPNLLTDKVDMSCQFITVTASRAQQVAFTLPYYREGVGLLLPNNSKYKEIEDLQAAGDSVTVAVLQNVYAEELVHQALPKAKVDQYDSVDSDVSGSELRSRRCRRHRPVFGEIPDGAEPWPLPQPDLCVEPANLRLCGQTWRSGLAEFRQHGVA
jgi:polar amino acid transport system substrate-binding protein